MYPRKHEVYEIVIFLMTLNKNHHIILMFQFGWKSIEYFFSKYISLKNASLGYIQLKKKSNTTNV